MCIILSTPSHCSSAPSTPLPRLLTRPYISSCPAPRGKRRGLPSERRAAGRLVSALQSFASGQSPRTPWQKVPPVNGGTSSCDARPRRVVMSRCGAIQEQRRGDACRSTVMQTASKESKQNGACPMLHSFNLLNCITSTVIDAAASAAEVV